MQQQNDTAAKGNNSREQNKNTQSPDPKKNSGLNSDQDTVVNEEDQDNIVNGTQSGTEQTDKEKSFHKNEMPDTVETDEGVPRIGDDPGEMESINPKM